MQQQVLVYLAGASRELERVNKWATALDRSSTVKLAHRWFDTAHSWAGNDSALSRRQQHLLADDEQLAIRSARIFWLLWPETKSPGAFIELGYALSHRFHVARQYAVVVSGESATRSIFTATTDYRSDSDALAFDALLVFANSMRVPATEAGR